MINRSIFRMYDIRGRVDADLDEAAVRAIAGAFGRYVQEQDREKIIVGRDNRFSSPRFRELVVETLLLSGLDVVDIGEVITPMFYFASRHLDIDAGMMITASHNPGEDNGFKLLLGNSTIYGEDISKIADLAETGDFISSTKKGNPSFYDISPAYRQDIMERIKLGERQLKVVVDCGNGTAGFIAPRLLRELGCEVIELYCDSDPSFPNHHPDPVKVENCQDLIRVVKAEEADLGIGFDGDGDRLGVVDTEGNIIWGDMLMILFWREILPSYPGTDCIVEVKCSQSLIDEIERLGGKPVIYKTGHSLIKAKMKEIGAVFTGEMSGHMFFADEYYGYDDALYAAARLLRILSHSEQSLSELLADVPRYHATPELRVKSSDSEKFAVVERVLSHYRNHHEVIDIDGARILFPGGWGLVRASNTGPELIVRCEAGTPEELERIKTELFTFLKV
ncbi:phosphomannomutase/phosphoglucomutase [Syntrophomonas wolfei]|uniref:phosphomannomutase/phosphoglucomutase n=1 Tax=Syntrophomonas wolfei TaxID=863 RepID=UPI0023F065D8|nr:phosphomannomutase/phosphoglucomutase [Syntrophomonas wolfei]